VLYPPWVSWREFVVKIVSAVAWPLTAVAILLIFRSQIRTLLSGHLKRLKAGPVEAEWDREIQETRAAVVAQEAVLEPGDSGDPSLDRFDVLRELALHEPSLAVLGGYQAVDAQIQSHARNAGFPSGHIIRPHELIEQGVVSGLTMSAVQGLRNLRNIAAHRPNEITAEQAAEFLELAEAVQSSMAGDERVRALMDQRIKTQRSSESSEDMWRRSFEGR
jgi:hypothetical protein